MWYYRERISQDNILGYPLFVFCDLNIVLSLSLSSQLAGQMVFFLHSKYVEIAGNINIKPQLMHTCHQL